MGKKKIKFNFMAPDAHDVKLCGTFSGWDQGGIMMKKGRSGEWVAQVNLEPGEYEYKYMADGIWCNDPSADRQIGNVWGSENSVKIVR